MSHGCLWAGGTPVVSSDGSAHADSLAMAETYHEEYLATIVEAGLFCIKGMNGARVVGKVLFSGWKQNHGNAAKQRGDVWLAAHHRFVLREGMGHVWLACEEDTLAAQSVFPRHHAARGYTSQSA